MCVLNHVPSAAHLAEFATAARAAGVTVSLVASVAVYTDEHIAAVLGNFPGLHLDPATVRTILGAPDPVAAGVAAALAEARRLMQVDGVIGGNLSGLASSRSEEFAAGVKAEIGREVMRWAR